MLAEVSNQIMEQFRLRAALVSPGMFPRGLQDLSIRRKN